MFISFHFHGIIALTAAKQICSSTFGSKEAKLLAEEPDVLDLGFDSSTYLSEIDGLRENRAVRPKLNSVVVIPEKEKSKSLNRKRNHSSREDSVHRAKFDERSHVPIAVPKLCIVSNTTSQFASTKQTETRGTQTDRTGTCKCARQQQQRNIRKRSENKTNKQIVDTLERVNIIRFPN